MRIRLKDAFDLQMGKTPARNTPSYWDGNHKWISIADIGSAGKYIATTKERITDKAITESGIRAVPAHTVIMSFKLSIGKTAITSEEMYTNEAIMAFISNGTYAIDTDYLYHMCCGTAWTEGTNKAVMGLTLNKATLSEKRISLPEITEQRNIAAKFDALDNVIEKTQSELSSLDRLVKSRFVEMFGDNETNPFGWKQSRVGDCCTLKSGTSLPAEVENEGGPIPYVKVGDMNYPGNERYITTSSRYVSLATAGNGIFEVGSIIFPKRGGAIGTNKKRMTKLPISADLNIMGVSSKGALLPEYLLVYFDMTDLGALSDGSSVPQINNKNIAPLRICLPPMELQKEFAAFVAEVDKSKLAIQQSLEKLETLKKALMQKYFG